MLSHALPDAVKTDRGDVVLRAGVVAPADLDVDPLQVIRDLTRREHLGHGTGQALRRGNTESARVRARAGRDVLGPFSPGIAEALRSQFFV